MITVDEKNLRNIVSIAFIESKEMTDNLPIADMKLKLSLITSIIKRCAALECPNVKIG